VTTDSHYKTVINSSLKRFGNTSCRLASLPRGGWPL